MIDNFSILLSHALLAIAFWFLTKRDDLDVEAPPVADSEPIGFGANRPNVRPPNKPAAPQDQG